MYHRGPVTRPSSTGPDRRSDPPRRGGILIALEGIDGSGKSTQAHRLVEDLRARGVDAVSFREPGDSEPGDHIRRLFEEGRSVSPEEEMRLFLEDRRIDVRDNIEPALRAGRVVVMDRYYFSSMAYQGALGLDPDEIRAANEAVAPRPDLTLVLDVPPGTGLERIHARRDVPNSFEGRDYLAEVRRLFLSFCEGDDGDVERVSAAGSADEVAERVRNRVEPLLEERGLL